MRGMLDRLEDNQLAVILIEEINKEIILPIKHLPKGSEEGTWFHIKEMNGSFEIIAIDDERTKKEIQRSKDLLAKLRTKSKGSKFKKN